MKSADFYIRAKCDNLISQLVSQHQQDKALESYCIANGISIREKVFDNCSAGSFNRPRWKDYVSRLLSSTIKPDLLLFTSWDRFSRNIEQAISIRSNLFTLGITAMPIDTHDELDKVLHLYGPANEFKASVILSLPFI